MRVDDDEAVFAGLGGEGGAEDGGGGAVAPVRVDEDGRVVREVVGDVDEEGDVCGVGPEVGGDLFEGGGAAEGHQVQCPEGEDAFEAGYYHLG